MGDRIDAATWVSWLYCDAMVDTGEGGRFAMCNGKRGTGSGDVGLPVVDITGVVALCWEEWWRESDGRELCRSMSVGLTA